jgi:hypothetical protein
MKNAIDFFGRKGTLFFCAIACVTALAVVGLAGCDDGGDDDTKPSGGVVDVSWTAVENSGFGDEYTDIIYDIAWGGNKFVAVGTSGTVAYSGDGISWPAVNTSTFDESFTIYGIAYGGASEAEKFVAVSYDADDGKGKIATSTDGEEWDSVTDTDLFTNFSINSIAYGNDMFVAVGTDTDGMGKGKMVTSTNGTTWVAVTTDTFGENFDKINGIAYGNGTFVAVGAKGKMATSTDGAEWKAVDASTFYSNISINSIAWGGNTFVAGGADGNMATSPNGTAWTAVEYDKSGGLLDIFGIAYGGASGAEKFVAAGGYGKMAYWAGK